MSRSGASAEDDAGWDAIGEKDGVIGYEAVLTDQRRQRRRIEHGTDEGQKGVRRGMHRQLMLVIDMSKAMAEENDVEFRPNRAQSTFGLVEDFVGKFFDSNPISYLGIIVTTDGKAERLTELSGNRSSHIQALRAYKDGKGKRPEGGPPSLQNALSKCKASFMETAGRGEEATKEIVCIMASITVCDPGDIHETVQSLVDEEIKCSVVALAAEVKICQTICAKTNGTHTVILHRQHFVESLLEHCTPPASIAEGHVTRLIRLGFPKLVSEAGPCSCCETPDLHEEGFICPQCKAKLCDLPTECRTCSLQLVASSDLLRSQHHLDPAPVYTRAAIPATDRTGCDGCGRLLVDQVVDQGATAYKYSCPLCKGSFCYDCDCFVHDVLHKCPQCLA